MYRILITQFALLTTFIIATSWLIEPLTLTPDSREYLNLASSLIDSPNLYMTDRNLGEDGTPYYAVWPIGYPATIALTAKISGLSVFWSSKLLNIVVLVSLIGVFILAFGESSPVYVTLLLFASYIKIFTYTWSESLFILFLIIFALSLARYFKSSEKSHIGWLLALGLSALCLFLSRYIGIFSIGIIATACIYTFVRENNLKRCLHLFLLCFALTSIELGYLYTNWVQTGFITGIERVAAPETNAELLSAFSEAMFLEFIFPISDFSRRESVLLLIGLVTTHLMLIILVVDRITKAVRINNFRIDHIAIFSLAVGVSYLISITALRWISDLDHFTYRLLAPATLLLLIGTIRIVEISCEEKHFQQLFLAISLSATASVIISTQDLNYIYQFIN